jgi:hypothetical protein
MAGKTRGRKRKNDLYFGPSEEEAVKKYLETEDYVERNAIYNEWLREPFNKMIESIIRRYGLYRKTETFEHLHNDTLSFLITKADKFEGSKGKKAYSYYGTICKNYLLGMIIKDRKTFTQNVSYEDVFSTIEKRDDMQYVIDEPKNALGELISGISLEIKTELDGDGTNNKKKLTDNEKKVGLALIEILDGWEAIFGNLDGNNKYNKNQFLADVREYTGLTTKDIRTAMKRFKKLYGLIKEQRIDEGLI